MTLSRSFIAMSLWHILQDEGGRINQWLVSPLPLWPLRFVWCGRNQRHTEYLEWGGPTGALLPGRRFFMILLTGRRVSWYLWSHSIGKGRNNLPVRWFVPREGVWFVVFKHQLEGLYRSIPASSVQKNQVGGAAVWWWRCPASKCLVVCMIIIPSSCLSFWLVSHHPLLQIQLHPMQCWCHDKYFLWHKVHMSSIFFLW